MLISSRLDFGKWDNDGNVVYAPGLDKTFELAKFAKLTGVVEKTSAKSSYYKRSDGANFSDGSKTKQGEQSLLQILRDDDALADEVRMRASMLKG